MDERSNKHGARLTAVLNGVVSEAEWTVEKLTEAFGLTKEEEEALRVLASSGGEGFTVLVERVHRSRPPNAI
jgi:hypothetical protein